MTVEIHQATVRDVSYIHANLRECDRREINATQFHEDTETFARHVVRNTDPLYVAVLANDAGGLLPVAAWGAGEMHPRVWRVGAFATDLWPKVALTVTRHIRSALIPRLYAGGAIRAEALSIAGHDDAHRWLQSLGAAIENEDGKDGGGMLNYGKNGETFYRFVWTRPGVEKRFGRAARIPTA